MEAWIGGKPAQNRVIGSRKFSGWINCELTRILERVTEISVRSDQRGAPRKLAAVVRFLAEPFFLKIPPMCLSSSTDY